jgi:4-diphosphocytidyl-2-C-methyl-D-erythritol kinase
MLTFPNAKINIGLHIVSKRSDEFHNIESCFYPIDWTDALEIVPANDFSFEASGLPIPGNQQDNLCKKAYDLIAADHTISQVEMHLLKSIPIGAGLGGGSADAAFTIKAINELFDLKMSLPEQLNYARQLGSDCAFFIENKPVYCINKGDEFEPIHLNLKGKFIYLVNPGLHISTQEAYAGIIPHAGDTTLRSLLEKPITTWKDTVFNHFENTIFPQYPSIAQIKQALYAQGAQYASMTGTGSTVYGIFEHEVQLDKHFTPFKTWKGTLK